MSATTLECGEGYLYAISQQNRNVTSNRNAGEDTKKIRVDIEKISKKKK